MTDTRRTAESIAKIVARDRAVPEVSVPGEVYYNTNTRRYYWVKKSDNRPLTVREARNSWIEGNR